MVGGRRWDRWEVDGERRCHATALARGHHTDVMTADHPLGTAIVRGGRQDGGVRTGACDGTAREDAAPTVPVGWSGCDFDEAVDGRGL